MVTINIKKKHLFLMSAIMIFMVGVSLVIGFDLTTWGMENWDSAAHPVWHDSPNVRVGSPDGTIETDLFSYLGYLTDRIGLLEQAPITCQTVTDQDTVTGGESTVECPSPYNVTGGGCMDITNPLTRVDRGISRPGTATGSSGNGWFCHTGNNNVKAIAICCK